MYLSHLSIIYLSIYLSIYLFHLRRCCPAPCTPRREVLVAESLAVGSMLDLGMNLVGSNRPLTARPKEQPKAVVSRPGSGRPQSGRLRPAAARALAAAHANRPHSTHGGRPPPQPPPKPTPPPKPLELEAACSFAATLEPLVHLLQPLLKASRKDDQQNGTLTLQVLLTAASLASTCGKDPGARLGRPSWKATVQGQTTVRRAKALVSAMRGSPRKDEKERALADLCLLLKSAPSAAAAALDEGVVLLVEMADCGSLKAKEHAASLLRQMAGSDAGRSAVAHAGGIAPLVKLVAAQARPPRLEAAAALHLLVDGPEEVDILHLVFDPAAFRAAAVWAATAASEVLVEDAGLVAVVAGAVDLHVPLMLAEEGVDAGVVEESVEPLLLRLRRLRRGGAAGRWLLLPKDLSKQVLLLVARHRGDGRHRGACGRRELRA